MELQDVETRNCRALRHGTAGHATRATFIRGFAREVWRWELYVGQERVLKGIANCFVVMIGGSRAVCIVGGRLTHFATEGLKFIDSMGDLTNFH
jgi:hypothetical protein